MVRESDVRLALGYHCVVNPSQNDVNEGRSREDHVAKETKVFTESKRMRKIPKENWGIIQLIDKIATLQEVLVDKHLPGIKEKVQDKIDDLEKEMRELPVRLQERAVLFNETTRKIREDLESRIKGESYDRDLAVAPVVAEMVREFKEELLSRNPNWLEQVMIDEVSARQAARQGYTVDNLTGPRSHIFIALIKQTFIESGLLRNWAYSLVTDVGEHLENVVQHVIQRHANVSGISPAVWCEKAKDCIDDLTTQARSDCETLALAQAETSTTCDAYKTQMQWFLHVGNLSKFGEAEACISLGGEYVYLDTLPKEFVHLGQQALHELQKRAVLEICASLQTYTKLMIEGFVETSAKLVKFRLVGQLVDKLEEVWRKELGRSSIEELGAEAESVAERRKHLSKKMKVLSDFEASKTGAPSVWGKIEIAQPFLNGMIENVKISFFTLNLSCAIFQPVIPIAPFAGRAEGSVPRTSTNAEGDILREGEGEGEGRKLITCKRDQHEAAVLCVGFCQRCGGRDIPRGRLNLQRELQPDGCAQSLAEPDPLCTRRVADQLPGNLWG